MSASGPVSAPLRLARALALGLVCTAGAALAYVAGGATRPGWIVLAVTSLLAVGLAWTVAARRVGVVSALGSVLVAQLLLHAVVGVVRELSPVLATATGRRIVLDCSDLACVQTWQALVAAPLGQVVVLSTVQLVLAALTAWCALRAEDAAVALLSTGLPALAAAALAPLVALLRTWTPPSVPGTGPAPVGWSAPSPRSLLGSDSVAPRRGPPAYSSYA